MNKRIIEYEVKLEKSLKVILAVLAIGVLLNAFSPIISAKNAFALKIPCQTGENYYSCVSSDTLNDIHDDVVRIKKSIWEISNGDCRSDKLC